MTTTETAFHTAKARVEALQDALRIAWKKRTDLSPDILYKAEDDLTDAAIAWCEEEKARIAE